MHSEQEACNILFYKQNQALLFYRSPNVIWKVPDISGAIHKCTTSISVNFFEDSLVKCHLLKFFTP